MFVFSLRNQMLVPDVVPSVSWFFLKSWILKDKDIKNFLNCLIFEAIDDIFSGNQSEMVFIVFVINSSSHVMLGILSLAKNGAATENKYDNGATCSTISLKKFLAWNYWCI